jgi:hypothetical protein
MTVEEISLLIYMKRIVGLGLPMAFSDNYAIKQMALPLLLSHLSQKTEHTAANILIVTITDLALVTTLSPLFVINIESVKLLQISITAAENSEEKQQALDKLTALFRNGLLYSAAIIPGVVVTFMLSDRIFMALGQDETTSLIAHDFLKRYVLCIPPIFFCTNCFQIVQSFQYKPAMITASFSLFFSLLLSTGLTFGYLEMPKLGENGILAGYTVEPYLSALFLGAFIFAHPRFSAFPFLKNLFTSLKGNLQPFLHMLLDGTAITLSVFVDRLLAFGKIGRAHV